MIFIMLKKNLEKKISNFISTGIEWVPLNEVEISEEKKEELINFFETLEDDDDVQNIYSNVKFSNVDIKYAYNWYRSRYFRLDLFF